MRSNRTPRQTRSIAKYTQDTFDRTKDAAADTGDPLVMTVAFHPDPKRIGARVEVRGKTISIGRLEPALSDGEPLDDPFISRTPQRVVLDESQPVIELSERVVFVLHRAREVPTDDFGLVGCSTALGNVRRQIRAAANTDFPVLIRAETGCGRELVARAIHEQSNRATGAFVAVNLGAIPPATSATELFGHEPGAFTGATQRRTGYFGAAEGGTLFLDEIGEAPPEVQAALLRALDASEIQPLGGQPRSVDVRILAATDADLEDGGFRAALLHRLTATDIRIPPLRERPEDVGLLLRHFMGELGALEDRSTESTTWPSTDVVKAMLQFEWPGNVRQLRNIARRLVSDGRNSPASAEALLGIRTSIDTDDMKSMPLLDVLRAHGFQLNKTARALGITRAKLDQRIAQTPGIRKAKDLTSEEIREALAKCPADVDSVAAMLEVSVRGLKLRMRQLGL